MTDNDRLQVRRSTTTRARISQVVASIAFALALILVVVTITPQTGTNFLGITEGQTGQIFGPVSIVLFFLAFAIGLGQQSTLTTSLLIGGGGLFIVDLLGQTLTMTRQFYYANPSGFFQFLSLSFIVLGTGLLRLFFARKSNFTMKATTMWMIICVIGIVIVAVAGLPYVTSGPSASPVAPTGPNITIWNNNVCSDSGNCGYSPNVKNVTLGTTITWTNNGMSHTVTSCDASHYISSGCPSQDAPGLNSFDSGIIQNGATFKWTFTVAGTYHYYCALHPWMHGTIVVEG
jgi:plastocyanin